MQDPYRVSEFDHNVSMITNGVPRALSGTRRLEASRGWLLTPVSSPHAMAALLASLWCSAPPPPALSTVTPQGQTLFSTQGRCVLLLSSCQPLELLMGLGPMDTHVHSDV